MNRATVVVVVLLVVPLSVQLGEACSVFSVLGADGTPRIGRNLDWVEGSVAWAQYLPPTEKGGYGVVLFGADDDVWPQGGMNDQGLVLGMTATPFLEISGGEGGLAMGWDFWELLFSSCATVEEVLAFLDTYDLGSVPGYLEAGQMLWSDAQGDSAIVEGDVVYRRGEAPYQIITNFLHSHPWLGGYPCSRYQTIEQMLSVDQAQLTDPYLIEIVEAAHGTIWGGYTVWSLLYDPVALEVTLLYQGDFSTSIVLDLSGELAAGTRGHDFDLLFEVCPGDREPTTIPAAVILDGCGETTAAFDCSGDRDVFTFTAPADGSYTIATGGQVNPALRLLDRYHEQIAADDNGGDDLNARVEIVLAAGDPVSIHLSEVSRRVGAYTLQVDGCPSDPRSVPRRTSGRVAPFESRSKAEQEPPSRARIR